MEKTTGPLAKMTDPEPEREALARLFAGAIGSSNSDNTPNICDLPGEQLSRDRLARNRN